MISPVRPLVGWMVGLPYFTKKGWKLQLHALIEALLILYMSISRTTIILTFAAWQKGIFATFANGHYGN